MFLHILLAAIHDGSRWTGLDAGGLESDGDPVGAQRAFVGLFVLLGNARNVERAAGHAVAAADAVLLLKVDDAVRVLHDGARRWAGFETTGVLAVHAAVLADQPLEVALGIFVLRETHQRPGRFAQIVRVVVMTGAGADLIA